MATPPCLNPPRLGDPITKECAYVKRSSAEKRAGFWNLVLVDDPVFGPTLGLIVDVAPIKDDDGRHQLVWVADGHTSVAPTGRSDENR